ncbi:Transducin/WD40 repeat-like superfamily protein [Perilla frutescens var. frutescens]|nr:Transducin/WD40 repeat-like superfamily protein [Perilla frutescens var. frutescens]
MDASKNIDANMDEFNKLLQDLKHAGDDTHEKYASQILLGSIPESFSEVRSALKYGGSKVTCDMIVTGLKAKENELKKLKSKPLHNEIMYVNKKPNHGFKYLNPENPSVLAAKRHRRNMHQDFVHNHASNYVHNHAHASKSAPNHAHNYNIDQKPRKTCWNCGKPGHFSNRCKMPKKNKGYGNYDHHANHVYDSANQANNVHEDSVNYDYLEGDGIYVVHAEYDFQFINYTNAISKNVHENKWLINSGCTFHVTPHKHMFHNLHYLSTGHVALADGQHYNESDNMNDHVIDDIDANDSASNNESGNDLSDNMNVSETDTSASSETKHKNKSDHESELVNLENYQLARDRPRRNPHSRNPNPNPLLRAISVCYSVSLAGILSAGSYLAFVSETAKGWKASSEPPTGLDTTTFTNSSLSRRFFFFFRLTHNSEIVVGLQFATDTTMPRTTTVETPGCPPLRALTFDALGLVKVLEVRGGQDGGAAKVVERWGDPDASKCVISASILDRESDPLVGIARKSGSVDVISAINGDLRVHIPDFCQAADCPEDDAIIGVHLLQKHKSESSSRSCTLLATTTKGHARIESVEFSRTSAEFVRDPSPTVWNVCGSGNILCSKINEDENYALFGGKGVEVNIWDLHKCAKIWTAKSPPKDNLGIFTPTWFTSATFLNKDDHRKFVAGTNSHQVRLYDISAQRRPMMSIDFRETSIKAVSEDIDGNTIYIGNGSGDLASIDMRTGKLLGCFIGKCSGSIRSIARHPELPVIASCGLDSYLRIWDIQSRQLLSAVFLKQHLTTVVFDSHFRNEVVASAAAPEVANMGEEDDLEATRVKRKKVSKEHRGSKKSKSKRSSKRFRGEEDD